MRAYPLVVLESAPITTPPSNSTAIVVVYKWVKKQYFIIQKFNVPFGKLIHVWVTDCWIEKRNFFFHFNHYSGVQYSGVVRQPQKIVWLVPSNLPLSSIWYLVDKPGNFTVYIFFLVIPLLRWNLIYNFLSFSEVCCVNTIFYTWKWVGRS